MSTFVYKGETVVRQPDRTRIVDGGTPETVRSWRGTRAALVAYRDEYVAPFCDSCEITGPNGNAILEASYAGDDGNQDGAQDTLSRTVTWELTWRELTKPLAVHSAFSGIASSTFEQMEKAIEDGTAGTLIGEWNEGDAEYEYLYRRLRGVDSFILRAPIVAKVTEAARRSDVAASFDGCGAVSSSIPGAGVDIADSAASRRKFNVPAGYEWLKIEPQVSSLPRGRFRISEEWWGADAWDGLLYEGGSWPA